jgi:hypothetical protein
MMRLHWTDHTRTNRVAEWHLGQPMPRIEQYCQAALIQADGHELDLLLRTIKNSAAPKEAGDFWKLPPTAIPRVATQEPDPPSTLELILRELKDSASRDATRARQFDDIHCQLVCIREEQRTQLSEACKRLGDILSLLEEKFTKQTKE